MSPAKHSSSAFITALLSHDISNYNQTSRGYLEMLQADQLGELTSDQARVVGICLRQTGRVQNLIDAVRLVVEMEDRPLNLDVCDLDQALRAAIVGVENEYPDREVRVRFVPAGRHVHAEKELTVLWRHLVGNAVRHNDAEVVEVDITVEAVEEPVPSWQVLVADNGPGLPRDRWDVLFSRLSSQDVHGSGIGLSLVNALIARWGGQVWLESSDPDRGSVVGVRLPRAD